MRIGIAAVLSAFTLHCGCAHLPKSTGIPEWQIEGLQVRHPSRHDVVYYFAGKSHIARSASAPREHVGFWVSEDCGRSWRLCSRIQGFEEVLVHPDTEVLFAVILDEFLDRDVDGVLVPKGGHKVVMSLNTNDWKDITPSGGRLPNVMCIFPDPDHTNSVCILCQERDLVVFQLQTNDLAVWQKHSGDQWANEHRGWDWMGFFAELQAGGPIDAVRHFRVGNTWQNRLRFKCHAEVQERDSHPHGAFISLTRIGNKESVPLLIKALRWQVPPTRHGSEMAVVCTTSHCVEALESLTGEELGYDPNKWEKWWRQTGMALPPEHFQPRGTGKTVDRDR